MHLVFNTLSVNNLSGRHVAGGHMQQVLNHLGGAIDISILYHGSNRDWLETLTGNFIPIECPADAGNWLARAMWENRKLPGVLKDIGATHLFSPAGSIVPRVRIKQISLAQNPWAFVRELHDSLGDKAKAFMQRSAYKTAQKSAALMTYNSYYMNDLYEGLADRSEEASLILYQGIDDRLFDLGRDAPPFDARRCEILTVSVMAPHKNIEHVVDAFAKVRRSGVDARLTLVGPWPHPEYRTSIERRIAEQGIGAFVEIKGYVSEADLHDAYAQARVFCLLSKCESFGIPAIEAQAFGTPSIVADCAAPPEIAGPGGEIVAPGAIDEAAAAMTKLLTEPDAWGDAHRRALANARRFRWSQCSLPLVGWLEKQS